MIDENPIIKVNTKIYPSSTAVSGAGYNIGMTSWNSVTGKLTEDIIIASGTWGKNE